MTDSTYNGWKNYPTWIINCWLGNDQDLYNATLERIAETAQAEESTSSYWTLEESRRYNTADVLKDFVEELAGDAYSAATFVADLLGYALSEVDWNEIADAWIESATELAEQK